MLIKLVDKQIAEAMENETIRQTNNINLIASENYASAAVMEAQGSNFTNKYAEGYPGRRYYGGCEYADVVENIAITRAKDLFKAEFANGLRADTFPFCPTPTNPANSLQTSFLSPLSFSSSAKTCPGQN